MVLAVIAITVGIIAVAPYIAITVVLGFIGWLVLRKDDEPPP